MSDNSDNCLFVHPELRSGEVFFTNGSGADFRRVEWQTKRLGCLAFDGIGNLLDISDWRPIFVDRLELEEASVSLGEARRQHRLRQQSTSDRAR